MPEDQTEAIQESKFMPGTLVLTKIKGFPEWPSRVMRFEMLPPMIQIMKPKSIKAKKPTTKFKKAKIPVQPVEVLCVRFYGDDEYIWCSNQDLKPLTQESVKQFLINKGEIPDEEGNFKTEKAAKVNKLTNAYLVANKADLSVEEFMEYGSNGKPEMVEIEEEEVIGLSDDENPESASGDSDEEEPKPKRKSAKRKAETTKTPKTTKKAKTVAKKKAEPKPKAKAATTKATKATMKTKAKTKGKEEPTPKVTKSKPKAKPKPKPEPVEEFDSDWGLDSGDDEDLVVEVETIPKSAELQEDSKKNIKLYTDLRIKIQDIIMPISESKIEDVENAENPDTKGTVKSQPVDYESRIKELELIVSKLFTLKSVSISGLRSTNLYKVLNVILKKPEYSESRFRGKLSDFIKNSFDLLIEVDERWGDGYVEPKKEDGEQSVTASATATPVPENHNDSNGKGSINGELKVENGQH